MLSDYEKKLLDGWEEVYKKSQLTLWVLLALKAGPKHMAAMKKFILDGTNGTVLADDKSMYRALRRYNDADLVAFTTQTNKKGPDKKIYKLTKSGFAVLDEFTKRNIQEVLLKAETQRLIKG